MQILLHMWREVCAERVHRFFIRQYESATLKIAAFIAAMLCVGDKFASEFGVFHDHRL